MRVNGISCTLMHHRPGELRGEQGCLKYSVLRQSSGSLYLTGHVLPAKRWEEKLSGLHV